MGVSIRRTFAALPSVLAEAITKHDMYALGIQARERIVRRTQQGKDSNNQPFTPYSEGYAKRKAQELGTGPVDLTVSGGMLNGIEVEATEKSVTLSFRG